MIRVLGVIAALAALVAAGFGAVELRAALADPVPPRPAPAEIAPEPAAAPTPRTEPRPPGTWPALFGAEDVPEPQPPAPPEPEAEPQPPAPPAPPLASLGWSLKGLVSTGAARWAIVAHPTGERLLRVGDPIPDTGYTVSAIDVRGLWAVTGPGGDPQLLAFPE